MRSIILTTILVLTSACGMDQLATKPSTEVPSDTNNPATTHVIDKQATNPNSPFSSAWPATGSISCTMNVAGVVDATYTVVMDANSRTVTVGYNDVLYQGHSYQGSYRHDLVRLHAGYVSGKDAQGNDVISYDLGGIANADAGSIWVDQADVAKDAKGYGRGWGFALDVGTMTLWGNPGGSVGPLGDWHVTTCSYSR